MKKLFLFILITLFGLTGFSQSVVPIRADTVVVYKSGGFANFRLENSTKALKGGVAYNVDGKGTFAFIHSRKSGDTLFVGGDTITNIGSGGGGGGGGGGSGDTLYVGSGLHTPNDSTIYIGGSLLEDASISGSDLYLFSFDSLTVFRIRDDNGNYWFAVSPQVGDHSVTIGDLGSAFNQTLISVQDIDSNVRIKAQAGMKVMLGNIATVPITNLRGQESSGINSDLYLPYTGNASDTIATLQDQRNKNVDIQVFNTAGSFTWNKPAGAKVVLVELMSGGGGGASGRRGAAGSDRSGGGGGGGGARAVMAFPAAVLGSSETVVVGAGGNGGAAQTADNTNGNNGSQGNNSGFGTWLQSIANVNSGGTGGGTITGNLGTGSAGFPVSGNQATNGASGTNGAGNSGVGAQAIGGAGAGGGGGINAANTAAAGGNGADLGISTLSGPVVTAGGTGGAVGSAGNPGTIPSLNACIGGTGSGGGGASTSGAAGAGADGFSYGAGGGGGGASVNGNNSGKGGNGHAGIVVITTFF